MNQPNDGQHRRTTTMGNEPPAQEGQRPTENHLAMRTVLSMLLP